MYYTQPLIHSVILVICVTIVVSLKKDEFYCQKASPCVCMSINNDGIDLNGVNVTLNITNNVTLYYQPCPNNDTPDAVAVSICYFRIFTFI